MMAFSSTLYSASTGAFFAFLPPNEMAFFLYDSNDLFLRADYPHARYVQDHTDNHCQPYPATERIPPRPAMQAYWDYSNLTQIRVPKMWKLFFREPLGKSCIRSP
jgi:hypothetical protein